jgi:hypothetical protein
MTNREALPEDDLWVWPDEDPDGDYPDWGQSSRAADDPAAAPGAGLRRTPVLLLVLIGMAAATLVVATALLVTGSFSGEISSNPRLETPTSAPDPITPTRTRPATASSAVPAPSTSAVVSSSAATVEPGPEVAPAPTDQAPTVSQPPAPASERTGSEGPRLNVTRTPMSFTPSIRGN